MKIKILPASKVTADCHLEWSLVKLNQAWIKADGNMPLQSLIADSLIEVNRALKKIKAKK